ncbi:MAG: hypothetical protein KC492_11760, partial [Myxococcales bacterium]|nr:hypothetical protein [Myxococcales bacterium]
MIKPLLTLSIGALCLGLTAAAHAHPDSITSLGLTPLPSSFNATECSDCHVSPSGSCGTAGDPLAPCLNPFGKAYRLSGWTTALGDADTDGDGLSNASELGTTGSAGFHASAEAAGCDQLACASGGGGRVACGSNVDCMATRDASPTYNYIFAFDCALHTAGTVSGTGAWSCSNFDECA